MITEKDINKLFDFLQIHSRPSMWPKRDTATLQAWILALKPYTYSQLMSAAVKYIRKKSFFPNAAELVELLEDTRAGKREREEFERLKLAATGFMERYHSKGLPCFSEAKRQGMSWNEWKLLVEEAGA